MNKNRLTIETNEKGEKNINKIFREIYGRLEPMYHQRKSVSSIQRSRSVVEKAFPNVFSWIATKKLHPLNTRPHRSTRWIVILKTIGVWVLRWYASPRHARPSISRMSFFIFCPNANGIVFFSFFFSFARLFGFFEFEWISCDEVGKQLRNKTSTGRTVTKK